MKLQFLRYLLFVCLLGFSGLSSPVFAEFQSGYTAGGLCFYEHANFKGGKFCAKSGEKISRLSRKWNNNFSSVQLDSSITVYACTNTNFGGKCRFINSDAYKLGDDWDDRISSIHISSKSNPVRPESTQQSSSREDDDVVVANRPEDTGRRDHSNRNENISRNEREEPRRRYDDEDIADLRTPTPGRRSLSEDSREPVDDNLIDEEEEKPEVCFFERRKFRGRSFCLTDSDTLQDLKGRWDNTISSIRVTGDIEIRICEDRGLEGECWKFRGSKKFVGWDWNDRISSLKVRFPRKDNSEEVDEEKDEVCFFEHKEFEGQSFCVPSGETVRRLRRWDERISSFIVHGNAKVRICSEIYLEGECTTFRRSKRFVGWTWNDEISSLRVGIQRSRE